MFSKKQGSGQDSKQVFLSYAWANTDIVNLIDDDLRKMGLLVKRDIRDLEAYGDIKGFMQIARRSDYYVLMVISKAFLESRNCMYEVLELLTDEEYKSRLLPIVLDDANLFSAEGRVHYIRYWESKLDHLNSQVKKLGEIAQVQSLIDEINHYRNIRGSIDEFIAEIANTNCVGFKELNSLRYKPIFDFIGNEGWQENRENLLFLPGGTREELTDQERLVLEKSESVIKSLKTSPIFPSLDSRAFLTQICDQLASSFSSFTHSYCSVSIQCLSVMKQYSESHLFTHTVARDKVSRERNRLDNAPKNVSENTAFEYVFRSHGNPSREVFFSNNLPSLKGYKDSSFKYYGSLIEELRFSILRRFYWPLPYKSIIVAPIAYPHSSDSIRKILGCLTVDSPKIGAFSLRDATLLSSVAHSISPTILSLLNDARERLSPGHFQDSDSG